MSAQGDTLHELELTRTIGFKGQIRNGLIFHPNKQHIIYAIGQTVMIKNITNNNEYRLHGHDNVVSCVAVSKEGLYIASGQENYMGYKAAVIIWDFNTKQPYDNYKIHSVKVEAIGFSCSTRFVASLGGQDCGSVVVYDITARAPLCGCSQASPLIGGLATLLRFTNQATDIFVTGGVNNLRVWHIDRKNKKVLPRETSLGHIKREIKCIDFDYNDVHMYCGTASGDILKICMNLHGEGGVTTKYDSKLLYCIARQTNRKLPADSPFYSIGVTALVVLRTNELLVGTGDGLVCRTSQVEIETKHRLTKISESQGALAKLSKPKTELRLRESMKTVVLGSVTSITLRGDGHQFLVGTNTCEIYQVSLTEFICELIYACHSDQVYDVVFPYACSSTFATCSKESIRVWNRHTCQELLRITVPNMICHSIFFMRDGRQLLSGWNDGMIRSYAPESGRLIYTIRDSHQRGVTAIAATSDTHRIVSAGGEGDVRVWDVSVITQILRATMKEHKGAITSIRMKDNDQQCVTSGSDGSCIIWDLVNFLRLQVVFANSLFQGVCFGPEACQIITCGSNGKVSYFDAIDGSQIRCLDANLALNAIDITDDCTTFVTGGSDKYIKVWKYTEGVVTRIGRGHSAEVSALRISYDKQCIISVSKDGCIIIWKFDV